MKKTMKKKKNTKKKKINIKEIINSTKFLSVIFFLLLILVIVLVVLCSIKSKEEDIKGFANMTFSLVEGETPIKFNVNAYTLAGTDEYIFKVTNFKGNKVSDEEIKYTVTIENNTNSVISVTVNDMNEDLMVNQKSTELKDTLKKGKKEAVYYHVKTVSAGDLGKKDLINIKIED